MRSSTLWRSLLLPPAIGMMVLMSVMAGCQTYTPAPLQLADFEDDFGRRTGPSETLERFARRLAASSAEVPAVFDPDDGLTCAEAEVVALFYNPSLQRLRAEAGVVRATRDTAGLWEDPVFGFDAAEIISPPTPFEFGVMGSLTIPLSGRLEIEKDRASAAYRATLQSIVDAEWTLRSRVRQHWVTWTAAVEGQELAEKLLSQMEKAVRLSASLTDLGELKRVEHRLVEIELAERQADLEQRRFQVMTEESRLLETLGLPPSSASSLIPGFPEVVVPVVPEDADRLIDCNPTLAWHLARFEVAEETLRLEIREQFPDLVIGSGYGSQFNDRRVMFGLTIPVPILNANQAAIAEALAAREVVRREAEEAFVELTFDLAEARRTLDLRQRQADGYTRDVLPLLIRQQDELNQIVSLGDVDLYLLVETARRTIAAKTRVVELEAARRSAAILIARLLGPASPDGPAPLTVPPDLEDSAP